MELIPGVNSIDSYCGSRESESTLKNPESNTTNRFVPSFILYMVPAHRAVKENMAGSITDPPTAVLQSYAALNITVNITYPHI